MELAYNPITEKINGGEPVVKDVCELCNSGFLSIVDNYLSDLFDKKLHEIVKAGSDVEFAYNFNDLSRALLKISYNSSRATSDSSARELLRKYSLYIRNGGLSPQFKIRLQIVTDSKQIRADSGEQIGIFEPNQLRGGTVPYQGSFSHRFLIRLVGINSYWFYIFIPRKPEKNHIWREFIGCFEKEFGLPGVEINREVDRIFISKSRTTYFHPSLLGKLGEALTKDKKSKM